MTNKSMAANLTSLGFDQSLAIIENGVVMKIMMVSPEVHGLLLNEHTILDISSLEMGEDVQEGMAYDPSNNTFTQSDSAFSYYANGTRYIAPGGHSEVTPEMIAKANLGIDISETN
jgi:hypothetical protein